MKILSGFSQDVRSLKKENGAYEWWYFDAISSDETVQIVIIFYDGNPFSRRYIRQQESGKNFSAQDFPAVSISIYKHAVPIYYSFFETTPESADFSSQKPYGKVGKNSFSGEVSDGELSYIIRLNQSLPNGDRIDGELTFTSKQISIQDLNQADEKDLHTWVLIQPHCDVSGNLVISGYDPHKIKFSGSGYHDHNLGREPMKDSFRSWYWGRFHFQDKTLIYYHMDKTTRLQNMALFIHDDGSVTHLNMKPKLLDVGMNSFALQSARQIEISTEEFQVYVQQDHLLDNGPFYQRFFSRAILYDQEKVFESRGVSEFLQPARIYSKLFWPLVNMRINYPDRTHWVQKYPSIYRWTW